MQITEVRDDFGVTLKAGNDKIIPMSGVNCFRDLISLAIGQGHENASQGIILIRNLRV